jgi:PKD repeat protein
MKRLIILSIILMASAGVASAAFNSADYTYSEDFFVNSTTAQTNYQVKMILDNRTGYSATTLFYTNGTTRPDWADVAWTDTSNNLLGFWKENRTDTVTNSTWWVNISSIANDNTTKIRLYYGNASEQTSYADGYNTFVLFDDFSGSSINTSQWTTNKNVTVSNSEVVISGGTGSSEINTAYIKSFSTYTNYKTKFRVMANQDTNGYSWAGFAYFNDPTRDGTGAYYDVSAPLFVTRNNDVDTYNTNGISYNTYTAVQIKVNASKVDYYINDATTPSRTHTTNVPDIGMYSIFYGYNVGGTLRTITVDWVFVAKYQAIEPFLTHSPGEAGDPPVASFTINKNYIRIPDIVICTDTSTESPGEWLWDFGDGTTSTDQNPIHQYTKRGAWNIILTATNDAGSDESDATTVRVIGYETYT